MAVVRDDIGGITSAHERLLTAGRVDTNDVRSSVIWTEQPLP